MHSEVAGGIRIPQNDNFYIMLLKVFFRHAIVGTALVSSGGEPEKVQQVMLVTATENQTKRVKGY